MTAPDHTLRRSENPCIEEGIQTWAPIGEHDSMLIDIAGARDALTLWNLAGARVVRGLVRRRAVECELSMIGVAA